MDDPDDKAMQTLISDILVWSHVADLRSDCAELSALCEDMIAGRASA